jgi:hypothetical protein
VTTPDPTTDLAADRRRLLKAGGIGALAAAIAAACSGPKTETATPKIKAQQTGSAPITNPDEAPATVPPAEPTVAMQQADLAALRTATSMEYAIVNAYGEVGKLQGVTPPSDFTAIVPIITAHHQSAITTLQTLTSDYVKDVKKGPNAKDFASLEVDKVVYKPGNLTDDNGQKDTNGNGWMWANVVQYGLKAIATPNDIVAFAKQLENTAVATYAVDAGVLSTATLRQSVMSIGAVEARHSAKLALTESPAEPGAPHSEFYTRDALGTLALLTYDGKPAASSGG